MLLPFYDSFDSVSVSVSVVVIVVVGGDQILVRYMLTLCPQHTRLPLALLPLQVSDFDSSADL
jgi:hypothetical protein